MTVMNPTEPGQSATGNDVAPKPAYVVCGKESFGGDFKELYHFEASDDIEAVKVGVNYIRGYEGTDKDGKSKHFNGHREGNNVFEYKIVNVRKGTVLS